MRHGLIRQTTGYDSGHDASPIGFALRILAPSVDAVKKSTVRDF
jgi:hypothetical protein